jgi:hypothetical protein
MLGMDPCDRIDAATAVRDFDAYWWSSGEVEEVTYSSQQQDGSGALAVALVYLCTTKYK